MSGGVLTDYDHNLYHLKEWAKRVREVNPVLAEQMMDLYQLLDAYDLFMSGDRNEEDIEEAWKAYRTKWLAIRPAEMVEYVTTRAKDEAIAYIDSFKTGHRDELLEGFQ